MSYIAMASFITRFTRSVNTSLVKRLRPAMVYPRSIESFESSIKLRIVPKVTNAPNEVISISDAINLVRTHHTNNKSIISVLEALNEIDKIEPLTHFDHIQLEHGGLEVLRFDCTSLHPKVDRSVSININRATQIIDEIKIETTLKKMISQARVTVIILGVSAVGAGLTILFQLPG